MNREQLVLDVARKSRVSHQKATEALDAVVDGIVHGLRRGKLVPLPGVGVFRTRRAPNARGKARARRVVVVTRFRKPAKARE